MTDFFTPEEERNLQLELAGGSTPLCPRCGSPMGTPPVPPKPEVAYVRTRAILQCRPCNLKCVVDRK